MKAFLSFFVCVALVSYNSAQGEDKPEEKNGDDVESEDLRRQFPGPYPVGFNPAPGAQAAAQAVANAQSSYRPTPGPGPLPNPRPGGAPHCFSCVDCKEALQANNLCTAYRDPRCVVYTEKHNLRKTVVRGCVSERGTCADLKREYQRHSKKLLWCEECVGDRCNDTNGVGRSLPDLTTALIFLVLTPIFTKYTLS